MAGAGKTRLIIHAGRLLVGDGVFDRVLFASLRGFHPDPEQRPAGPAAVLDGFLRLLGVPGHRIPQDLAARVRAYQARLAAAGGHVLVVLDDAATVEQTRPLTAGAAGCLTVVTSRRALGGADHAARLTVGAFTRAEATAFLRDAVGASRCAADPAAVLRIARCCGNLPLALGLIAGHIRRTPDWELADHADRLAERRRDHRLDPGVQLALRGSYHHLPADLRRLLRMLALHPGQHFDAPAVAALGGSADDLHRLRTDHLVQPAGRDRYGLHDLVRAFAAERARDEDAPRQRRDALTRLFEHYLAMASRAVTTLYPARSRPRPFADARAAITWLDTERATLLAVAACTAANGWPELTIRLADVLQRYLAAGNQADALAVQGVAAEAAAACGDRHGLARALAALGVTHIRCGRLDEATHLLHRALSLFRQLDDQAGQADTRFEMGYAAIRRAGYSPAREHLRSALSIYRNRGDVTGQIRALHAIGMCLYWTGRVTGSIGCYRRSLLLARRAGDRGGEARALHGIGEAEVRLGRNAPAERKLRRALILYRRLGNRIGEAGLLDGLGTLHTRRGRFGPAAACYRRALTIVRDVGDRANEASILNNLGTLTRVAGRPAEALAHHARAADLAREIGSRHDQAHADAGLGHARHALGDRTAARDHYRRAVDIYADLGVPEHRQIRSRLAQLELR